MFGVNYTHKKDMRKLLTDYSSFENPLLKSYPSEGFFDVFYNFFEDQVVIGNKSVIEL
jgi:NADH:ubiquinone oxidoreductase subunit C